MKKNKIYFASDFHLGSPSLSESHKREKIIVKWLTDIEKDAKAIYLVGDIFDFWFEYKKVIPKGFVRLLGKLAQLSDNGINVHLITGNHDLWLADYLEEEVGITIHHESIIIEENKKKILIGHGDGLGKGDYFYKGLKKIFTSRICQFLFARLHPNLAFTIAHKWSKWSRMKKQQKKYINYEKDILFEYCQKHQELHQVDYYIFGHQHKPGKLKVDELATYVNLGEWIESKSYAIFDQKNIILTKYKAIQ